VKHKSPRGVGVFAISGTHHGRLFGALAAGLLFCVFKSRSADLYQVGSHHQTQLFHGESASYDPSLQVGTILHEDDRLEARGLTGQVLLKHPELDALLGILENRQEGKLTVLVAPRLQLNQGRMRISTHGLTSATNLVLVPNTGAVLIPGTELH